MKYIAPQEAVLMLEDGTLFRGVSIGKKGTTTGEICFNTGMTGYQEIYTDPSYYAQIVVNTNAHIGNYGVHLQEIESTDVKISGLVVKTFSDIYSRNSAYSSLQQYLEKAGIIGICNIDTRELVQYIRSKGAMNGVITTDYDSCNFAERFAEIPDMNGLELASKICTQEPYFVGESSAKYRVAVMDFGIKSSILNNLASRGIFCQVFPAKTPFSEVMEWNPDGFFISNGPGDPASMGYAIKTTQEMLRTNKPLFGICLGHQILALASGLSTYKMHNGHRGLNHPVKNLITGRCEVTSQNHGFAVSATEIDKNPDVILSHINLNDQTVEGIRIKNRPAFSVQYHPESSPGPHDSHYLFDDFLELLVQ